VTPEPSLEEIECEIVALLASVRSESPDEVREALLAGGEGMPCDSLDSVEILLELEERFQVQLPDNQETADAMRSVRALARHVRTQVHQGAR
jgi:acyl carrier protein